jgi:two-component system chemotaxis response regulator CheY
MAKILVVDDSESQRAQLKTDLESGGHTVIEGSNGHDGLDKLTQNPDVALVICDVNMPGMDGLTMCSKIKQTEKFPNLPIFMLTSEATAELKKAAKEYGVRAWITKPYVAAKLLEALGKVIKK